MEPVVIQTSRESFIMVSGTAPSMFRGPFKAAWLALGILLGLVLLSILLLLGLRFPLHIPQNTALLVTVSPKNAQAGLKPEIFDTLPAIWKKALSSGSSWPVVLGATPGDNGWQTFALIPRWQNKNFLSPEIQEKSGLVTLVSTEPHLAGQKELKYTDDWPRIGQQASIWIDFLPLLQKNPSFLPKNWDLGSFEASLDDKKVRFSLSVPTTISSETSLTDADIVLNNLKNDEKSVLNHLLATIPFGEGSFAEIPTEIKTMNLWMDHQTEIVKKEAYFTEKITIEQAKSLLSGLGIVSKTVIQLPDGTLAVERLALPANPEDIFRTFETPDFGTVEMQENRVAYGDLSVSNTQKIPLCVSKPILRLSSKTVNHILSLVTGKTIQHFPSMQLGEEKNHLVLCSE